MALASVRIPVLFRQSVVPKTNFDGNAPDVLQVDDSYRRRLNVDCTSHAGLFRFDSKWIRNLLSIRLSAPGATGYTIEVVNDAGRGFVYETATGLAGVSLVRANIQCALMEGDCVRVTTVGVGPADIHGVVCEIYADLLGTSEIPY